MYSWLDQDTWIISDTHFGHDNIVRFCDRPKDHEELMIENWNSVVGKTDFVLHLGDLTYRGDRDYNKHSLRSLNGRKYFIKGNHDRQTMSWYEKAGFTHVGKSLYPNDMFPKARYGFYYSLNNKKILFSHYPDEVRYWWNINIHGHTHNKTPFIKSNYINVSTEMINYTPIQLGAILEEVNGRSK